MLRRVVLSNQLVDLLFSLRPTEANNMHRTYHYMLFPENFNNLNTESTTTVSILTDGEINYLLDCIQILKEMFSEVEAQVTPYQKAVIIFPGKAAMALDRAKEILEEGEYQLRSAKDNLPMIVRLEVTQNEILTLRQFVNLMLAGFAREITNASNKVSADKIDILSEILGEKENPFGTKDLFVSLAGQRGILKIKPGDIDIREIRIIRAFFADLARAQEDLLLIIENDDAFVAAMGEVISENPLQNLKRKLDLAFA